MTCCDRKTPSQLKTKQQLPTKSLQRIVKKSVKLILPRSLTWNLKISPWKRRFLLETIIFRFHVKFRGCNSSCAFSLGRKRIIALIGSSFASAKASVQWTLRNGDSYGAAWSKIQQVVHCVYTLPVSNSHMKLIPLERKFRAPGNLTWIPKIWFVKDI